MKIENPNYYAILTADVRYDHNLSSSEKLLYGEITALTSKTGECWASNKYFADLYKVSAKTISLWIKNLINNGYIISEITRAENKQVVKRVLHLCVYPSPQKCSYPPHKNVKENNTSINNTSKEAELPKESPSSKELNTKKVNEIFNIFKEMNIELPKVYYQNKTQRNSAVELYDSKGVEKVRNALEYYQDLKEKGVDYLITIYSPYDLLVKYEKLKDFKEEKK